MNLQGAYFPVKHPCLHNKNVKTLHPMRCHSIQPSMRANQNPKTKTCFRKKYIKPLARVKNTLYNTHKK